MPKLTEEKKPTKNVRFMLTYHVNDNHKFIQGVVNNISDNTQKKLNVGSPRLNIKTKLRTGMDATRHSSHLNIILLPTNKLADCQYRNKVSKKKRSQIWNIKYI